MMVLESALRETALEYNWSAETCFDGLPLSHVAFMDASIMWQPDMSTMQTRLEQLQKGLSKWGLHINVKKSQMYLTEAYTGPRELEVAGVCLQPNDHLLVMGLRLHERCKTSESLLSLLACTGKG